MFLVFSCLCGELIAFMVQPLVSIITPTYNHEKYIGDCIRSVLAQTYRDWEMIIVDDGSADQTAEVVQSLPDIRIKYIRQEHLGSERLGATYNRALKEARGEFIAILEGDDFWPPNKLEIQMPYFSNKNIILTHGDCIITNENGRKLFYRRIINNESIYNNYPIGSALKGLMKAQNILNALTVIVKRDTLLKIGGFIQPEYLHLVDYPTWCRLSLAGEFKGIPQLLGYWRRNINSLTLSNPLIISDSFIRYTKEFTSAHQEQIQRLNIKINIDELQKNNQEHLDFANKHQDFSKGLTTLVYGYNQKARTYFRTYLKQSGKKLSYALISYIGILLSFTPILKITFPLIGIYLSRPLSALKRLLLTPPDSSY